MTRIYDFTDRSILSAILVHFSVNLTGTLAAHGTRVELFRVLICWAWALGTFFLPKKSAGAREGFRDRQPAMILERQIPNPAVNLLR